MQGEPDSSAVPVALVQARQCAKGYWVWRVSVCPYCGRQHTHGAGDGPRPTGLGHRSAHCSTRSDDAARGYELRQLGGTS
ncbi:hypothetical protein JJB11_22160 [Ramlibacter ginsenosidimutans]|uniref:Uncharacterized protein n=1 Tax=Ramlibacter ginsenosidimutans TaxID=502333 RepID=A0A934WPX4_9BURK|nr:hypothetical protein [Ramlibacter ginsenosidimutans]MBK6008810.1 hypothetical protein [Ramlibacter ginsenosidimutans]